MNSTLKKYVHILTQKNFLWGLCVGIGVCTSIYVGIYVTEIPCKKAAYKFNQILHYIEKYYVDEVPPQTLENLTEVAIAKVIKELDPHTTYVRAQQNVISQAELNGGFEGIGVEFTILDGIMYVLNVIPQGPADQVGIQAGDKITQIDDQDWTGKDLTSDKLVEKIRGPEGTAVKLTVQRGPTKKKLEFNVVRRKIPTASIDACYMITPQVGYIKIHQFGRHTHTEFIEKINQLKEQGMLKLLLDLRNNGGGYLHTVLQIAEEMLEPGKLILYTKGKHKAFQTTYKANGKNSLQQIPIVILLNEHSASAPELLAGALQDQDRAWVVGRRSFGKGLVQLPISFKDKSVLNLTIERYYTPSGRFIQKPYENHEDYRLDLWNRYKNGELFQADKIQFDPQLKHETSIGRPVYGGGGIIPDYFVPLSTTPYDAYINDLLEHYLIQQVAIEYMQTHREQLSRISLADYVTNFTVSNELLQQVISQSRQAGLKHKKLTTAAHQAILHLLKAHIARLMWQDQGYYSVINQTDTVVLKGLQCFDQAAALLQESASYQAEQTRKSLEAQK
jgi:carboxyl-terminal processing protease